MASLYKRNGSSFWWIAYRDAAGRRKFESTKLKHSDAVQTRRARDLLADFDREQAEASEPEAFAAWVVRYLHQRYSDVPLTLERYLNSWRNLSDYLRTVGVRYPRQLTRAHTYGYLAWRQGLGVNKNTALYDLNIMRLLMFESVQMGFCAVNPCVNLRVPKEPQRQKPRITDEEHAYITEKLKSEDEWMGISYKIGWEQGCRLSEVEVPLADIDLGRMVIGFRTKGHKAKVAEFPLSERLAPLVMQRESQGHQLLCKLPGHASVYWTRFFRKVGLPQFCFHCLRVTFVTRCYERGLTRDEVMRLVGHASALVHAIYPRLTADAAMAQALRKLL